VIREVHAAALPATALVVTAPSTAVVGTPVNVSVTATDATGATASGYMGTVHFTSVGGTPAMPADYTFTSADKGTHTFTVTFNTPSNQTLIVTDTSNPTLTGTATVAVRTPAPTVSSISPTSGSPGGGTSVTITGTNLWDLSTSAAVDFGTKPATVATCSTATSCTAISPAGSGTVDVTVNTRVGTSAPPPPTASLISAPP
ncbi:MAG TPA: IPT/TIG domain-containing protein, partial [Acidimicrobiales bacterium]|nr:IPT/TIG domain-containing protein [Acidimicrobiales bacterium]